MMSTVVRRSSSLLVCLAVAALACACSSNSTSSTSQGNAGSTPAASGSASGTPILIGSEAPVNNPVYSLPNFPLAAQAAVDSINEAGGVNGHPLKFDFCNTELTAAQELACARTLISDRVTAVVDPIVVADQSGAELKLFEQAGIPYFGGQGASPEELENPDSYPLTSGAVGWFYGVAKVLKQAGATKVAIYTNNSPSGPFAGGLVSDGLKALKVTDVGTFTADLQADPTLASSAAKVVASGANGVAVLPENLPLMIRALSQAGYKGKLAIIDVDAQSATLKALGSLASGILVSALTALPVDTSNPAVMRFRAAMQKYAPGAAIDGTAIQVYAAVQLFAKVMATAGGTATGAAAFAAALSNLSTPVDIGLIGPWAVKGRTPALSAYPRILNPIIAFGVIRNGVVVPNPDGFSNPFTSS